MDGRARFGVRFLLAALAGCALAAAPAAASSTQVVRVDGAAAPLPQGAQVVGALPAPEKEKLHLTVALEPQDPSGLENYAAEVATPSSPLFHHYLSVSQFAQSFGATPAQIATVKSALQAQGVSVGTPMANDLTLPVTGSAAQVEKAFSTSLSQVKLPTGRVAYANLEPPAVPASAAQFVQGVIGLDSVPREEPQGLSLAPAFHPPEALSKPASATHNGASQIVTGGPQPCEQAENAPKEVAAGTGYTDDKIASAYGFSTLYQQGDLGAGQTIALFEEEPYSSTAVAEYEACYGTSTSITNVPVGGGPGEFKGQEHEGDEEALDIEQVVGLAPKANVLVYQGSFTLPNSPVEIISTMVSQDAAKVISSSDGVCESLNPPSIISSENTLLQEAATQGQSFFISSGDSGSQQCAQSTEGKNRELSVLNPAGQPFATGVGGTLLYSGEAKAAEAYTGEKPPAEGVWSEGTQSEGGSSGGGLSKTFAMPSYQSGAAGSLGVVKGESSASPSPCGATFCREVPDISADASAKTGYVIFEENKWTVSGGTSAAAPLWAAFTALANATPTCRGIPIGFANPSLYSIAGSSYLSNFHDITEPDLFTGRADNNPEEGTLPFAVGPGYDMATGLGSMVGPALAASLCAQAAPVFAVGVGNPGAQTGTVGVPLKLQIAGSDSGGLPLSFSASGLPAGLSMSASGLISGTPTTAQATTVTVAAGDSKANAGSTAFTWSVAIPIAPPTVSGVSLTGIAKRKAKLKFTVTAGGNAPAFKSIALKLPGGLNFSHSSKTLLKGILVKGASGKKVKVKVKVHNGILAITLAKSVRKATFTITSPAISVSGNLASKVKHRKVKALNVAVTVTDISHRVTPLIFRTKVS
jgi:Pro-kumamolisin, activation domain/Putative Ig domain/Subtilase family